MPEAATIFISAHSPDLLTARAAVQKVLAQSGCISVTQDPGGHDASTLRTLLRQRIGACRGVIHLVGQAYGPEPSAGDASEIRRSAAQLEYEVAAELRKPVAVFLCTERFPYDPHLPEDAEQARLQQVHRAAIQLPGRVFRPVENIAELEAEVRALRFDPAPPPALALTGSNRLLWIAAALGVLFFLTLLAGGAFFYLWWKSREPEFPPAPVAVTESSPPPESAAATPQPAPSATSHSTARSESPNRPSPERPRVSAESPPDAERARAAAAERANAQAARSAAAAGSAPTNAADLPPPPAASADNTPVTEDVRREVLKRIDLAPDIPHEQKDRLHLAVQRAREMRRLAVLPFETAQSRLSPRDQATLRQLIATPEFRRFRDDLTAVIVVLGFADTRGNPTQNHALSAARARHVRQLLQSSGGINNVIHPVPMGQTTLLDERSHAKNRIAEIWGVVP